MKYSELTNAANALAEKIDVLTNISAPIERHSLSDLIMGMIRANYVLIRDETIERYNNQDNKYKEATLHPEDLLIHPNDNLKALQPIFANSFGPWNPKEYFNLNGDWNEPRLVWILKESFIEDTWFTEHDRGGHDQAKEYPNWDCLEYPTHIRVVNLSKIILEGICGKIFTKAEVMNHICILELNHFPGLAFHSKYSEKNDHFLTEWAKINIQLIKSLLKFYSPNIVIGGGTLKMIHKCPPSQCESFNSNLIDNINKENTLLNNLGYKIDNQYANDYYINGSNGDSYIFKTLDNGPIFIQANHPTQYYYSKAINDVIRIKNIIGDKNI